MITNEKVDFRLFCMPCCSMLVCWVNPRLPTHCPGCGKVVLHQLRTEPEHTQMRANAWLRLETK